jgi:hypothetical protein
MSKLHDLYKKLDDQLRDAEWDAAVDAADKSMFRYHPCLSHNILEFWT